MHNNQVNYLFLLLVAVVSVTRAQVFRSGKCSEKVQTQQDLDLSKYINVRWYEHSKYPFAFEFNGKCIYATYGSLPSGDVSVHNHQRDRLTQQQKEIQGSAKVVAPGKFKVQFPGMPSFLGGADYWVLSTDYEQYSVVYSCTELFGLFHTEVVWILTRNRRPSQETIDTARKIIELNGLSLDPLQKTDQENCPADYENEI